VNSRNGSVIYDDDSTINIVVVIIIITATTTTTTSTAFIHSYSFNTTQLNSEKWNK